MAAAFVEKATSDTLIETDWGMNIETCDIINDDPGQAKDILKALKKRLGNKNTNVQFLSLMLLETLVKNCDDNIHILIIERGVLHEMVKIAKKKSDFRTREKILALLDAWREAFGGSQGKFPQYYAAYHELVRAGVEFPQHSDRSSMLTTQQSHQVTLHPASSGSSDYGGEAAEASVASGHPGMRVQRRR